jgi:hypothetical protein
MSDMRKQVVLGVVAGCLAAAQGQSCRDIRGRAETFSATARTEIWQVGTNHTFFVTDQKSTELIEQYLRYPESDSQALFADFTICPTEEFKRGFSQRTVVKEIRKPRIVRR